MTGYIGETKLEGTDILVLVTYFVIVIAFGLWSSLKNRGTVGGYFLAGRSMNFVLVGTSLFASNIGSGHFIGLAGSGAASGIGIAVFELSAMYVFVFLGWYFVPVYIASGVFTMPEYLRLRFGGQRIRVYLAVMALLLSIFTKVAADLFAGAIFIELAFGWNLYAAISLLLAISALFTIAGGLTAVIWTDFVQTIIMLIGALYLMIVAFIKIGGWESTEYSYMNSIPSTYINSSNKCGLPVNNAFHLIRGYTDPFLPWPGVMFGLTISAVWYCCCDQVMVQRVLSSKDMSHAKAGCLLASYLKFLPMWIMVLPGMISRILFTGLMLAVMMAALMSSLTSIFNSSSTIFTMDIWILIRKNCSDMEKMIVGRVFVLVMVIIGIAWIPIVQNFSELFHYIQSVTSYLAPPVCAVYVLALSWERVNEKGAFWGLMVGLVIGVIRFGWESAYPQIPCAETTDNPKPAILADVHYLHFGIILFVIVVIVTVVISLLTKPINSIHLVRLTFSTRHSKEERIPIWEADNAKYESHDNPGFSGSCFDIEDTVVGDTLFREKKDAWYKTAANWMCGIEKHPEIEQLTPEQEAAIMKKQTSLKEVPLYKKLCNVNAVVLLTITAFYWGFFY